MTVVNLAIPSKVKVGDQFSAKVTVDGVVDFDAANYDIDFDAAVLSIVQLKDGIIGTTVVPIDMWRDFGNGKLRIINNLPELAGVSGAGYLAEVIFEVVSFKKTSVLAYSNGILGNNQGVQIPATWLGNALSISVVGDVDGDGLVGATDIALVEQMILELVTVTSEADVNGDGVVNCLDITAIKKLM
jgi:hypothetical protein